MAPPPAKMQQIQQFLTSVLSQRGPTALPYSETTKWLIRQHLLTLVSSYSSLEPKTATFTHNDGGSAMLLQGVSYNIPVVLWLLESYPLDPPRVYVNPTRDMIIKRPHSNVSPSGLVSLPYLLSWVYPTSNLLHLASHLCSAFSRDPPLYSLRRPPIDKLADMVHVDLVTMRSAGEAEAEGLLSLQAALERREGELSRGLREMSSERETLEQELQLLSMNTDVLDSWISRSKNLLFADLDLDTAFLCVDSTTMSTQMLECAASDLAIEDAVYAMDKAFRDGVLPFDQYLRNVRLLSREQFFHRATGEKVRGMQMDAQVASVAARLQL